ncbi:MAG: response regulator transcription factor [Thermodesulfobacteriota bacterium]
MVEPMLHILIVEDDFITSKFLRRCLVKAKQYDVSQAGDGQEALKMIQSVQPDMIITDWMMPKMDGLELCRSIRALHLDDYIYILILTARTSREDIINGLSAGADDYVLKPFDQEELLARVRAGARMLQVQRALRRANEELKAALAQIKTLKGLLPICMDCKKIRDDQDYWREVEEYIYHATGTEFSHGLCPDCLTKRLAELEKLKKPGPR